MRALSSLGTLDAPRAGRRACRPGPQRIVLALAPTARSLQLETDDARIARYVRLAYGATIVDSVAEPSDVAVVSTGTGKTIVSFNGIDALREWPAAGTESWRSGAYVVDQLVWQTLAGERTWTALYACAVVIHGRAVLLAGASGVGKTTLGLALQRLGARVIGDEMIVMRSGPSAVDAIDRRLSVRWRAGDPLGDPSLHGLIRREAATIGFGRNRFLAIDRRAFGAPPSQAPLAATFVLSRAGGSPRIAAAGTTRTALALGPYAARRPNGLEEVARLAEVLSAGRCFTLSLADPNASARAILEELETC